MAVGVGGFVSQKNLVVQGILNKLPANLVFQAIVDDEIKLLIEGVVPLDADNFPFEVRVIVRDKGNQGDVRKFLSELSKCAKIEDIANAQITLTQNLPELFVGQEVRVNPLKPPSDGHRKVDKVFIKAGEKIRIEFACDIKISSNMDTLRQEVEVTPSIKFKYKDFEATTIYDYLSPTILDSVRNHFSIVRAEESKTSMLDKYANAGEWS